MVGPSFWRLGVASDAVLFSGTLPALLSEDMGAGIGMASLEAAVSHGRVWLLLVARELPLYAQAMGTCCVVEAWWRLGTWPCKLKL